MPLSFSRGIERTVLPRKPTTSPGCESPAGPTISQHSPREQKGPSDSTIWPTALVTRPYQRAVDKVSRRWKYGANREGFFIRVSVDAGPGGQKIPARFP